MRTRATLDLASLSLDTGVTLATLAACGLTLFTKLASLEAKTEDVKLSLEKVENVVDKGFKGLDSRFDTLFAAILTSKMKPAQQTATQTPQQPQQSLAQSPTP